MFLMMCSSLYIIHGSIIYRCTILTIEQLLFVCLYLQHMAIQRTYVHSISRRYLPEDVKNANRSAAHVFDYLSHWHIRSQSLQKNWSSIYPVLRCDNYFRRIPGYFLGPANPTWQVRQGRRAHEARK